MVRNRLSLFVLALGLAGAPAAFASSLVSGNWSLELGGSYTSGKYGTDVRTETWSLPLTLAWASGGDWDAQLGISYLHISNGATVGIGGTRVMRRMGTTSGMGGGGMGGGMGSTSTASTGAASGWGDTQLEVGYRLLSETPAHPRLRLLAAVKLPTADEDKGLGTGAVDVAGGLGCGKTFGPWGTFLEARYLIPGSADELELKNSLSLEGEAGYTTPSRLYAGLDLWYATPAASGAPSQAELRGKLTVPLGTRFDLKGYLGFGLADGSPDQSAGLSLVRYF